MKRLCSFLCLCLSLCILFPAFLISPSASEVDGNTVYTYWYIDNVEDLQLFENTIVSLSKPYTFYINATIVLNEPIPSNTLFDLDIGLQFDSYADPSVEVQFVEPGYTVIGNAVVDIVNDHISMSSLQFDYDISRLYLKFYVTYPTWTTIQTVYDFTIDGVTYECEKNQTWDAWCSSIYNTLGLFVEDGYMYYENGDTLKILYSGDSAVNNYDLVDKDKTYYLKENTPAVTIIQFYIGNNSCTAESGMTWDAWVNSEYNTLSLIVDGTALYTSDKSAILANNGIPVIATNTIIAGNTYTLSSYVVYPKFFFNGQQYEYEDGMTWQDFVDSNFNLLNLSIQNGKVYYGSSLVKYNSFSHNSSGNLVPSGFIFDISSTDQIETERYIASQNKTWYLTYGTSPYLDSETVYPGSVSTISRSRFQYEFDFSITSVSVNIQDESGLLNGVIAWLKKIWNGISGLAGNIAASIGNSLEEWFVPNDGRILAIKEEFEQELRGRFGVLFDAVDIVDMVADTFVYKGTTETITLPSVTVDLAGTPFTFGGYEVDVIPDGFEGLVDALRLVVNITCTWWFVLAMKKRLEEVLSK